MLKGGYRVSLDPSLSVDPTCRSREDATVVDYDGKDARSEARSVEGNGLGTVAPLVLIETRRTCHSTIIIPTM